jgi:hypothetical protein
MADAAGRVQGSPRLLAVRIHQKTYRVSNATLDELFGVGRWRNMNSARLEQDLRAQHAVGALVSDGHRLRLPSASEQAEQRLRSVDGHDEILRNGLLYVATEIKALRAELQSFRDSLDSETTVANEPISRAASDDAQLEQPP